MLPLNAPHICHKLSGKSSHTYYHGLRIIFFFFITLGNLFAFGLCQPWQKCLPAFSYPSCHKFGACLICTFWDYNWHRKYLLKCDPKYLCVVFHFRFSIFIFNFMSLHFNSRSVSQYLSFFIFHSLSQSPYLTLGRCLPPGSILVWHLCSGISLSCTL